MRAIAITIGLISTATAACYYATDPQPFSTPDATEDPDEPVINGEFPCEVAEVLRRCQGCHSDPPRANAPFPLMRRADLVAAAPGFLDTTIAERSLIRM